MRCGCAGQYAASEAWVAWQISACLAAPSSAATAPPDSRDRLSMLPRRTLTLYSFIKQLLRQ
ncbi:MAG: hypothetical protein AW07_03568 [Candidatus Accumulibacter sp. SK-11]|nr:MAG: hypothetical protein AW07_03568 [Candidatus Accumulibacter sp. SK-11]